MICYHGSDTVVDSPKILEPKRPLDFGGGFYVTTSQEQAKNWAKKVAECTCQILKNILKLL